MPFYFARENGGMPISFCSPRDRVFVRKGEKAKFAIIFLAGQVRCYFLNFIGGGQGGMLNSFGVGRLMPKG